MKKKLILILLLITCIFICIVGILINNKSYDYEMIYFDGQIPGSTYYIYVDKHYNFKVKTKTACSTNRCPWYIKLAKTYRVKLSDDKKEVVRNFIYNLKQDEGSKSIDLNKQHLTDKETNVIKEIIYYYE